MTDNEKRALIAEAAGAARRAYAPYSGFSVGAALLLRDGRVFTGCNIENASYSVTVCAERVALFSAVAHGARDFAAIAVVGSSDGDFTRPCPPCGVCRQALAEFCDPDSFTVILADGDEVRELALCELLPHSFGEQLK